MRKKFDNLHVESKTKRKIEVLAKMSDMAQSEFVKGFIDDLYSVAMFEDNARGFYVFKIVIPNEKNKRKTREENK